MRRAAIYLRVSTRGQQDSGYGLEAQRQRCRAYASENRLDVVTTVTEAKSAGVKDGEVLSWEGRPILLDLVERAESDSYDVLLVSSVDRLSRDMASAIVLERMLEKHGVSIISVETGENGGPKTPEAELFSTMRSAIAQYERATIKLRLAGGRAIGKKKGRLVSGKPPYGFGTKDGTLVPNQDADTVKAMFVDFLDGRSPGRIARDLTIACVPSPRGGTWNRQTITNILGCRIYLGEMHGVRNAHARIVTTRMFNKAQNVPAD